MKLINGLNRKYIEGSDVEYIYYSKHMLKTNLIIVANTLPYEDCSEELGWSVETSIEVKHYNDIDAVSFTVYQGDYLHDIQVYRIVKDIYDLYLDNALSDFLYIINEWSVGSQSQSMQSKKENAVSVRNRILSDFAEINWDVIGISTNNQSLLADPIPNRVVLYFAIEKCREMQLKMQRFATHLIPFRQCVGQSIALAMKRDDMGVMN